MSSVSQELGEIELHALLETVYQHYGYDFRDYAQTSLKRRIRRCIGAEQLTTVSGLQERVLHDPAAMQRLVEAISVDSTSMFRDPGFYLAFREKVVPLLQVQPLIRIWHAGCASGEEVYAMAILLQEAGLFEKTRLYATDMSGTSLERARAGIFPLAAMRTFSENYSQAGGTHAFSEYYTARYDYAVFRSDLQQNIVWAQHNLVGDAAFNEFQVIVCRNVMIYFNQALQARVHGLLYDSLAVGGILGLGSKESLGSTPHRVCYSELDSRQRLYQKLK